jgi:hypothetical protein
MKKINLSEIMILAWTIYHTLKSGSHREKLSMALKSAWAQYRSPKPETVFTADEQPEDVTIQYPTGKITFNIRAALYKLKISEFKSMVKLSAQSDRSYNTNAVSLWSMGVDREIKILKYDLDYAKSARKTSREINGIKNRLEKMQKYAAFLTA